MRTALVTNVTQYAGPGVVAALARQGVRFVCHDASFLESATRDTFRATHAGVECLASQTPDALVAELEGRALDIDAVVSNDVYPITRQAIGEIDPTNLRSTFEAVFIFPLQLAPSLLPGAQAERRQPSSNVRRQSRYTFLQGAPDAS